MITSNIAFYPCKDIEETMAFYSNLIGLKLVYEFGKARVFSANKGHFGFVQYEGNEPAKGRLCLSLNCEKKEDVDIEYKRITGLGGKPAGEPEQHPDFPVYSFFIEDPNGYLVEFQKIEGMDI